MSYNYFSGSYSAEDVRFLLQPIAVENTPVPLKEKLIQSGQKHYSQMLTHEKLPSAMYLQLFEQALADNRQLMAEHSLILAQKILHSRPNGITLVSLARAGTPVGVILKRILAAHFAQDVAHYSISIVRDMGIDENALLHILSRHSPASLVFVDGWTGKGVIARQLQTSLQLFAERYGVNIPAELYVLADLSGSAFVSASAEDYLIPSSILNATVSGLVSRSVLDKTQLSASDYHGCYFYQEYADADLSRHFVDTIMDSVSAILAEMAVNQEITLGYVGNTLLNYRSQLVEPVMDSVSTILAEAALNQELTLDTVNKLLLNNRSKQFLQWVRQVYGINDQNLIKPGIGEATRVLLRREADILLLRDSGDASVKHLCYLAETKNIPVRIYPELPYRAAALIAALSKEQP